MQPWPMPELYLQNSANTGRWLPQLPCEMDQRQCSEMVGMPTCGITYRFFSCTGSFRKMKIESGLGCCCLVLKSCLDSLVTPWTIYSPPGSSVHGILWAKILEWIDISFFRESPWPSDRTCTPALQADSLTLSHHYLACSQRNENHLKESHTCLTRFYPFTTLFKTSVKAEILFCNIGTWSC